MFFSGWLHCTVLAKLRCKVLGECLLQSMNAYSLPHSLFILPQTRCRGNSQAECGNSLNLEANSQCIEMS